MAIFHVTREHLVPLAPTRFGAEGLLERRDLQRLLRARIEALGEDLLVVAEEFGEWEDSGRRIDLLCLDQEANLVVVELKRTEDGGHMELQAIRYAAMISPMTFGELVETYARTLAPTAPSIDEARSRILAFLGWSEPDEEHFNRDVRILLVAADFSKELTTSIIWLNDHGLSIRAVRLKPYRMTTGEVLVDVQQVIPLPEAEEFQTRIDLKKKEERQQRAERYDIRLKFWAGLLALAKTRTGLHAGRSPTQDGYLSTSIGRAGFSLNYAIRQHDSRVELWIGFGPGRDEDNLRAFRQLEAKKREIEAAFGAALDWQELPESSGCRICYVIPGGYRDPAEQWPTTFETLVDAMIRLDRAMRPHVQAVVVWSRSGRDNRDELAMIEVKPP